MNYLFMKIKQMKIILRLSSLLDDQLKGFVIYIQQV